MIKWLDIWFEGRPVANWWKTLVNVQVFWDDEYEGHTADINSDHAKAGLALVDEARAKLEKYNAARA